MLWNILKNQKNLRLYTVLENIMSTDINIRKKLFGNFNQNIAKLEFLLHLWQQTFCKSYNVVYVNKNTFFVKDANYFCINNNLNVNLKI